MKINLKLVLYKNIAYKMFPEIVPFKNIYHSTEYWGHKAKFFFALDNIKRK